MEDWASIRTQAWDFLEQGRVDECSVLLDILEGHVDDDYLDDIEEGYIRLVTDVNIERIIDYQVLFKFIAACMLSYEGCAEYCLMVALFHRKYELLGAIIDGYKDLNKDAYFEEGSLNDFYARLEENYIDNLEFYTRSAIAGKSLIVFLAEKMITIDVLSKMAVFSIAQDLIQQEFKYATKPVFFSDEARKGDEIDGMFLLRLITQYDADPVVMHAQLVEHLEPTESFTTAVPPLLCRISEEQKINAEILKFATLSALVNFASDNPESQDDFEKKNKIEKLVPSLILTSNPYVLIYTINMIFSLNKEERAMLSCNQIVSAITSCFSNTDMKVRFAMLKLLVTTETQRFPFETIPPQGDLLLDPSWFQRLLKSNPQSILANVSNALPSLIGGLVRYSILEPDIDPLIIRELPLEAIVSLQCVAKSPVSFFESSSHERRCSSPSMSRTKFPSPTSQ